MKTLATFALGCAFAAAAGAQVWPSKAVRIVVPAPAGSSLDIIARTLGDKLKDHWHQPVVIDNKAGAGGMLGMDAKPAATSSMGFGPVPPAASSSSR